MEPKEQKQAIGSVSFGGISVSSDIYIRSDTHIRIKLCGLSRVCDIEATNELKPDYIGFVFAPGSRRYVPPCRARELKEMLLPGIQTVGVFVREDPEVIVGLLDDGIIDLAQLHGGEDEDYIHRLRELTDRPVIKAFRIDSEEDIRAAEASSADYILLDSGSGGTGTAFDWKLLSDMKRPYFLAGGLDPDNAGEAVRRLKPCGVDVSSGIETEGQKDKSKMAAFVHAVRKEERL